MAKMVPTYTKHIDTINKIGDLAYRAGHTKDIETAMVLMDSVLSAIPYLGPLALLVKGILSIFMSTESELKLVMNKLGEMNRKLDRIYDRVTEAIGKIESVAIESSFKVRSLIIKPFLSKLFKSIKLKFLIFLYFLTRLKVEKCTP